MRKTGRQRGIGKRFIRIAFQVFQVKNTTQFRRKGILGNSIVIGKRSANVRTDKRTFLLIEVACIYVVIITASYVERPLQGEGFFQTHRSGKRVQGLPVSVSSNQAGSEQREIKKTLHKF